MISLDDYIVDVLMRDLAGHDRRPVSFLVYLWFATEQSRRKSPVLVSYYDLAESIGISRSAAQSAVGWLNQRGLLTITRDSATAVPRYTVHRPWKDAEQRTIRGA